MEEIITKNNLDTYTTGLKSVLENIASNAGGSSSAGEEITIKFGGSSGTPYAVVSSGTKVVGTYYDEDVVTIPYGVQWTITPYDGNDVAQDKINGTANVMATGVFVDMSGYGAIDLGLPSGKLWAGKNVGASSSTDAGLYFSWGNIEGHASGSGYNFDSTTYSSTTGGALSTSFDSGDSRYDAATAIMGSPWRTPTQTEFNELINNCTWTWGSGGYTVTGKNGNSIFLPAAGYYFGTSLNYSGSDGRYWSTEYYSSSYAYDLYFYSSSKDMNYDNRICGQSIRAVMNSPF